MTVRIFKNVDGGVSVIYPSAKSRREDETEEQWLDRVFTKSTQKGAEYVDVPKTTISSDRTFRNAWIKNGKGIEVDMPKAREIHMDRIRTARNKKLVELDVPFMQAVEQKDITKQEEIASEKQKLRDIPHTFDLTAVETIDELKSLWPKDLPSYEKTLRNNI